MCILSCDLSDKKSHSRNQAYLLRTPGNEASMAHASLVPGLAISLGMRLSLASSVCATWFAVVGIAWHRAWCTNSLVTVLATRWCRFCGISTKWSFCGELKSVITLELKHFQQNSYVDFVCYIECFCWYLSLAHQVPVAPAKMVTDGQMDRHTRWVLEPRPCLGASLTLTRKHRSVHQ